MRTKMIGIFMCILFMATVLPVIGTHLEVPNRNNMCSFDNSLDGGWLEEIDGVSVLHLSGTNYEMGYQHGYLLKDEIEQNYRAMMNFLDQVGWNYSKLLELWQTMEPYLPLEYLSEMQGMADGSTLEFDTIAVLHTIPAVTNLISCWGLSAWDSATDDGRLIHVRSLDGIAHVQDPVTGKYLQENQVMIVRDPDNGYASLCPEFAGDIVCWGGINEHGIAIGELSQSSQDTTFHGINGAFRMRMVMDYASTSEEALTIMNSNRTCGWNFIVSDGTIPCGFVIEQTANYVYVGNWMSPTESIDPFWPIEDVVRRGNLYISPVLAATQRDLYDPSGVSGFIQFLLRKNPYFVVWSQYKAISDEIQNQFGTLTMNSTMMLLRDVYTGQTDIVFKFIQLLGGYVPGHQWVAYPKTGDLVICFASQDTIASDNPVHYFNLFALLDAEPP